MKKIISYAIIGSLLLMSPLVFASNTDKITICHATASAHNPYVEISVADDSITHGHGHDGHDDDIIPPFDYGSPEQHYPGKNWDATHQAILNNHCEAPTGGGGGGNPPPCDIPATPTGFDIQNAVSNDHQLELVWNASSTNATTINIKYGMDGNNLDHSTSSTNDGFEAITGLPNGVSEFFQIQAVNSCGVSAWTSIIDPLP